MNKYVVLFISLLLDLLGFTVILPLIPSILDYYAANDNSGFYRYIDEQIGKFAYWIDSPVAFNKVLFGGLIGSWFSFLQFLVSPLISAVSDVYGRRSTMLICLSGVSLSYLVWLQSKESFLLFVISRTIGGLSKGNVSLSTAVVADISTENKRGKGMALIGIAFSIGFIVGPLLGATFAAHSRSRGVTTSETFFYLPALFALSLSLLNIIFVAVSFEESLPAENRIHLIVLCETGWIYFQFLFLYSGMDYTLSFLTHTRFNYTSIQQGKMYLFVGLFMSFIQGGFVRRIKPGKEPLYALIGIVFIVPSFVIIGLASTIKELYGGLALYSFASATTVPCLTTVASILGPTNQKGVVLGIFRSIGALARALGPVFASIVFWKFGSACCYLGGAILMLFPMVRVYRLRQITNEKKIA